MFRFVLPAPTLDGIDITDADAVHRFTMSLFPDGLPQPPRANAGVLWAHHGADGLIVQSLIAPVRLPPGAQPLPVLPVPEHGSAVSFDLVADLVARRTAPDGTIRTRASSCVTDWVRERTEGALTGISLTTVDTRPVRRRGHPLRLVHLRGVGAVCDCEALERLVAVGVGRSKAFGAGLLRLTPQQSCYGQACA